MSREDHTNKITEFDSTHIAEKLKAFYPKEVEAGTRRTTTTNERMENNNNNNNKCCIANN